MESEALEEPEEPEEAGDSIKVFNNSLASVRLEVPEGSKELEGPKELEEPKTLEVEEASREQIGNSETRPETRSRTDVTLCHPLHFLQDLRQLVPLLFTSVNHLKIL